MLQDRSGPRAALLLVSLFFLGISLFLNLPVIHQGFLAGDQAVYYAMAQSIAFDGDIEYTKKDLLRYKQDFAAGPVGIFLKRERRDSGEKLYYAKNLAYPLFASPFVRIFGPNGPLVFHAVLLFLLLLMGFSYFSLANSPGLSLLRILTFLFASVAWIYYLWIAPEFFNLVMVSGALFLWNFKIRSREAGFPEAAAKPGWGLRFLSSERSDYLAAFIAGIAVYSKPPNVAVLGPLLLWALLKKKYFKSLGMAGAAALSIGLLFGINFLWTSAWNYQGGDRKTFIYNYPYEKDGVTFDNAPNSYAMTADGYIERTLLPVKFVAYNLFYYFFGRYTGVAWYFFPALLFLILFFMGKKSLDRWLIGVALAGEILIYIVLMPNNYGGGGGSLANRYFLNIYPFFLFLPAMKVKHKELLAAWGMAAVFLGQILIAPFNASARPSTQGKSFPFTLLPIEKTLINDLPTNTSPPAFRQTWGSPPKMDRFLYFLNDNFNRKSATEDGWWTLGDRTMDAMLRTFFPAREIVVHLRSNPRLENEVTVSVEGRTQTISLGDAETADLRFPVDDGFQIRTSHQYRIKIRASKGSFPYYEEKKSRDERWLGVFFTLEVVPR